MQTTLEQKAPPSDPQENGKLAEIESLARKAGFRHTLAIAQIARIVYATRFLATNPLARDAFEEPILLLDHALCELGKLFPEFLSIKTLTLCQTSPEDPQQVILSDVPNKGLFDEIYCALHQDCQAERLRNELLAFNPENGHVN